MAIDCETREQFVTAYDKHIYVKTWIPDDDKKKYPIILFHDSLGCVQLWREFPALLAQTMKQCVVAYDRLGFGLSDARSKKPNINFIAEEAEIIIPLLLKQLSIDKFVAFGHSVGGCMAIHCAAYFPNECLAVITESAQAFIETRTIDGISNAKKAFANSQELAKLQKYHGEKAEGVLAAWTEVWLSSEFSNWSLKNILPLVLCPLLAIHGDHDEYGSVAFPAVLTSLVRGKATQFILTNCGHVPHQEQPDLLLKEVSKFLSINVL